MNSATNLVFAVYLALGPGHQTQDGQKTVAAVPRPATAKPGAKTGATPGVVATDPDYKIDRKSVV